MQQRISSFSRLLVVLAAFAVVTCAPDYKDIATENGRQALLDLANNYLTSGDCDAAIRTLDPLMKSQYVNNDARMIYASAFGCKGGMNMGAQIISLKDVSGTDIWTPMVKSNFSSTVSDGHVAALNTASDILCQTSTTPPGTAASTRGSDANTYMVFVQLNIMASVLGPLGVADRATGHKTRSITGLGASADKCQIQVALGIITDSLQFVNAGSAISNLAVAANAACMAAVGGPCPANKDLNTCAAGNPVGLALQAQGQLLINALDTQWSF